jgi:predicted transcriptional regulator
VVAERGSLERLVMDQLWRAERPLLIREILERVNAARNEAPLAYTTMQTVCDRLTAKGALERIPAGRANLYRPTHSRDEHIAHLMIEALADSSDRSSVFTWFVELVDGNDARKLRAALESRRGRRRPTR